MIHLTDELMKLSNSEIARQLGVTPQAVLYARRRSQGKCPRCGRKADLGVQFCRKHRKAVNAGNRARNGHKPWKPGGKGRPPIVVVQEAA